MGSGRNIYLEMKTLAEARRIMRDFFSLSGGLAAEEVPVLDAVGRVLSESVSARLSSPAFHLAAMDGVAVNASDTFSASEARPLRLKVGEKAWHVNTGHVMPENTNAVIMIEHVLEMEDGSIQIEAPAFPWQNVRKVGEDIVATEMLFPRNHRISPYCLGALLAAGISEVRVWKRPRALIIPTGNELVDVSDVSERGILPGQVIESNSHVLGKLVEASGGEFVRREMVGDDAGQIEEAVMSGVESGFDFVMITGGSSAGSEDHSRRVIATLGRVLVHGVTIMPGKPLIVGEVSSRPVFGIPGYPVSAIIAFEQFVAPMIAGMLGQAEAVRPCVFVEPTRKIASRLGVEEFLRVRIGKVGDRIVATPLPRGAGAITTITEADGIIRIPNDVEGLKEFEPVHAELLRPLASVENTIVAVGSHDNTLDLLADMIRAKEPAITLSSSHVGSMGGLMAVKKGACHLAGSHLLDVEDGSYNLSYIRKYLPDKKVKLVNLVLRDQGLIVRKGNPKGIHGIEDLCRPDISMVNRQGGSGTRILLDCSLEEKGIDPGRIKGYQNEEFTHMSVAVAVLSGAVDVGLGIAAAARALELDFIPVVTEQYDLVIPEAFYRTEKIQVLLDVVCSQSFQNAVQKLGGYSTAKTGTVIL